MLVKISERCSMGCSHCMEDATPEGKLMTMGIFLETKKFVEKIYSQIPTKFLFLSGGEPTENPLLFDFLSLLKGWKTIIMTNGEVSEEYMKRLLSFNVDIQITNDPRYYPRRVTLPTHPRITTGDTVRNITPLGRAKKNDLPSERMGPLCFNLRSVARGIDSFKGAVIFLRSIGKFCIPSIDVEGNVRAGESRLCQKIGTVKSPDHELLGELLKGFCGDCGILTKGCLSLTLT